VVPRLMLGSICLQLRPAGGDVLAPAPVTSGSWPVPVQPGLRLAGGQLVVEGHADGPSDPAHPLGLDALAVEDEIGSPTRNAAGGTGYGLKPQAKRP